MHFKSRSGFVSHTWVGSKIGPFLEQSNVKFIQLNESNLFVAYAVIAHVKFSVIPPELIDLPLNLLDIVFYWFRTLYPFGREWDCVLQRLTQIVQHIESFFNALVAVFHFTAIHFRAFGPDNKRIYTFIVFQVGCCSNKTACGSRNTQINTHDPHATLPHFTIPVFTVGSAVIKQCNCLWAYCWNWQVKWQSHIIITIFFVNGDLSQCRCYMLWQDWVISSIILKIIDARFRLFDWQVTEIFSVITLNSLSLDSQVQHIVD